MKRLLPAAVLVLAGAAVCAQADPAMAVDESIPCDPEPTDMSISYSDAVSCSIDVVGDVDIFRFSGTAGEVVTLLASRTGGGFNPAPCIELFGPGGGPVDSSCNFAGARLDLTLGQTGVYSILVSESGNNDSMNYTLVVERVAPPSNSARSICPGCELQESIDPVGDLDLFVFLGTAGDVITLLASRTGGGFNPAPCIELFDPGGGPVDSSCNFAGARLDLTLGQTGVYSILVSESGNNDRMNYTLSYQCIVGVCSMCQAADGQSLTLQDDTVLDSQSFEVCDTIEVGPNYHVAGPNGSLTLRAGHAVIFKADVSVGVDGALVVDIDPSLRP